MIRTDLYQRATAVAQGNPELWLRIKHLSGGHDQASHGRRGAAAAQAVIDKPDGDFKKVGGLYWAGTAGAEMRKHTTEWREGLTPYQRGYLQKYSELDYGNINKHLRVPDYFLPGKITELADAAIESMDTSMTATLDQDRFLFRGIQGSEIFERLKSVGAGGVWSDAAYTSTTLDPNVAFEGRFGGGSGDRVHLSIRAPKGTRGAWMAQFSSYGSELEFLLPRDSAFYLNSVKVGKTGALEVTATLLPQDQTAVKHLQGKHDQASHGRRGGGSGSAAQFAADYVDDNLTRFNSPPMFVGTTPGPKRMEDYYKSLGFTTDEISKVRELMDAHGVSGPMQKRADESIVAHLNSNTRIGKLIEAQMDVEEALLNQYINTSRTYTVQKRIDEVTENFDWYITQDRGQSVPSVILGWPDYYRPNYASNEEMWDAIQDDIRFLKENAAPRIYRKGSLDKPVLAWTWSESGAQMYGRHSGGIGWNHSMSSEDILKDYRVLGGLSRAMGAPGESEITLIRRDALNPQKVKHLSGQHDQKTHGYRFGKAPNLDRARQMRQEGTWDEYRRRADARGIGSGRSRERREKLYSEAHETIRQARSEFVSKQADFHTAYHAAQDARLKMAKAKNKALVELDRIDEKHDKYLWAAKRAEEARYAQLDGDKSITAERLNALYESRDRLAAEWDDQRDRAAKAQDAVNEARLDYETKKGEFDKVDYFYRIHEKEYLAKTERARRVALLHGREEAAGVRETLVAAHTKQEREMRGLQAEIDRLQTDIMPHAWDSDEYQTNLAQQSKVMDQMIKAKSATNKATEALWQNERLGGFDEPYSEFASYGKPKTVHLSTWQEGDDAFRDFMGPNAVLAGVKPEIGFMSRQIKDDGSQEYDDGRAFHSRGRVYMSREDTGNSGRATVVHELGHAAEYIDPAIGAESRRWLRRRQGKGKQQRLADMFPTHGYDDHEVSVPDRLLEGYKRKTYGPYAGKIYGGGATEVLSMGLQLFYNDPVGFARSDPDYFDFVYAVTRMGNL